MKSARRSELKNATSINSVLSIEAMAAGSYWASWASLNILFSKIDSTRIPDHWQVFGTRKSPITGSQRLAINPPNAILNYLYSMLEAEARLAAAELGLDPGLGILHRDTPNRDSLACDLMEPVRPLVDAYLFDWLNRGPLRREWFFEQVNGNCRLMGEFAAQLSETASIWRKAIGPIAEKAAKTIWQGREKIHSPQSLPSRLTHAKRSQGRKNYRVAQARPSSTEPEIDLRCPICGERIRKGARCCAGCAPLFNRAKMLQVSKIGRIATHSAVAEARRSASHLKQVKALKEWNRGSSNGQHTLLEINLAQSKRDHFAGTQTELRDQETHCSGSFLQP